MIDWLSLMLGANLGLVFAFVCLKDKESFYRFLWWLDGH